MSSRSNEISCKILTSRNLAFFLTIFASLFSFLTFKSLCRFFEPQGSKIAVSGFDNKLLENFCW